MLSSSSATAHSTIDLRVSTGVWALSQLTAATLCWAEGQAEWLPLQDIPELEDVLRQPALAPGSAS